MMSSLNWDLNATRNLTFSLLFCIYFMATILSSSTILLWAPSALSNSSCQKRKIRNHQMGILTFLPPKGQNYLFEKPSFLPLLLQRERCTLRHPGVLSLIHSYYFHSLVLYTPSFLCFLSSIPPSLLILSLNISYPHSRKPPLYQRQKERKKVLQDLMVAFQLWLFSPSEPMAG